jgi:hypothetical protein
VIAGMLTWLSQHADLTLLAAPFVVAGYRLGRRKDPRAWLAMVSSNLILLAFGVQLVLTFGLAGLHLGLLVSAYLVVQGGRNYLAWRRGASE